MPSEAVTRNIEACKILEVKTKYKWLTAVCMVIYEFPNEYFVLPKYSNV